MKLQKRLRVIEWFMIVFFVITLALSGCSGSSGQKSYDIVESYKITIPLSQTAWLQVDLPISYGYQQVEELQVKGSDSWNITTYDDYQTLLCTLEGTGSEQLVSISYTVTLHGDTDSWQLPLRDEFLLPSEFVDSDNMAIQTAVEPLIVDGNEYETAKNIHRFVTETVEFRTETAINQMTMAASEVLEARKGVCGDYAHLMTALLRAAGIPARDVAGNAMKNLRKPADWQHSGDSHAWVEFYVDGAWHFADPAWGNGTFDNPDTWHLSYGMAMSYINSQMVIDFYNGIEQQGYFIFGGMTAPLHFTSWCTSDDAVITPCAEVV